MAQIGEDRVKKPQPKLPPPPAYPFIPVGRGSGGQIKNSQDAAGYEYYQAQILPAYRPSSGYNYWAQQQGLLPAQSNTSGGGGGGGGGGETSNPLTWSNKYNLEGAPSWWKGMLPSQWTPESELASMVNALIPYLSAEDQRQMGSTLSRMFPDAFGSYSPQTVSYERSKEAIPTSSEIHYFQSVRRAEDILKALDTMRSASGQEVSKFGPGYQYLRDVAKTMADYGAYDDDLRMSRRQIVGLYGALDPLLAETKGEKLGAYGEIARGVAQPFFAATELLGVKKDSNGNWVFGAPNKSWY